MLRKKELFRNRSLYLMALPALFVYFLFAYLPMPGLIIAFKNYNYMDGMFKSPWSGLNNFKFYFTSGDFALTTFNTLWINFNNILWGTVIAIVFALFLNEIKNRTMKKLFQSLMFLPYFFSFIIVSKLVLILLADNGLFNQLLSYFGKEAVLWYSSPQYWVNILVGTSIWKNVGYSVIIYLATIAGIDEEVCEASVLDGASRIQQIRYIILPNIIPVMIILTLLAIGRIFFGDFALNYSLVGENGILFPTTNIIDTYIYRAVMGTQYGDFGMITAVGLYQSFFGLIMILGSNLLVKKYEPEYSLF